jgi:hypothetical protein
MIDRQIESPIPIPPGGEKGIEQPIHVIRIDPMPESCTKMRTSSFLCRLGGPPSPVSRNHEINDGLLQLDAIP